MRAIIYGVLFVGLIVGASGCRRGRAGVKTDEQKVTAAEADAEFEQLLTGKDKDGERTMEARQYLGANQSANGLWKTSRAQTLEWVNELYQAGAMKVYAVYSPADETIKVNMCASLLVALPAERDARGKVIAAFNRIDKEVWGPDHERIRDVGQKYLMLNMDP